MNVIATHSAPVAEVSVTSGSILVGGSMAVATRLSRFTGAVLAVFVLLVLAAAWLAIDKPF